MPPDPDFDHAVHLAHTAPVTPRRQHALGGLVVGYGLAGAIGGILFFSRLVLNSLGLPWVATVVAWTLIGVGGLAVLGWLLIRSHRINREEPSARRIHSDERYRVRCIGPEARLEQLRRLGPIDDNPFEPQEFFGFFVLPPRRGMIVVWVLTSLAIAGFAHLLPLGIPPGAGVLVFYGAFAAGGAAVILIWPTTIRIVPGRVDCIRWLVFRPDRPEIRTFTLRTSPVMVDLRRWRAFIDGPSRETSIELWIWPIPARLELAHALLTGAVSSARPPLLPSEGAPSAS